MNAMHHQTIARLSRLMATGLALMTSLAAQAQVGMSTWHVQARPVTLIYPTQAVSRPQTFGPFTINVALKASASELNQVVVIGYGSTTKRDMTGSVKSVKSTDFNRGVINSTAIPMRQIQLGLKYSF